MDLHLLEDRSTYSQTRAQETWTGVSRWSGQQWNATEAADDAAEKARAGSSRLTGRLGHIGRVGGCYEGNVRMAPRRGSHLGRSTRAAL